jgi:hypothetical protein
MHDTVLDWRNILSWRGVGGGTDKTQEQWNNKYMKEETKDSTNT